MPSRVGNALPGKLGNENREGEGSRCFWLSMFDSERTLYAFCETRVNVGLYAAVVQSRCVTLNKVKSDTSIGFAHS